jgi:hypothetical protein
MSATASIAPNMADRTGTAVRPRPGSSAKRTPIIAGAGMPAAAATRTTFGVLSGWSLSRAAAR